jgi:hypothetical protein
VFELKITSCHLHTFQLIIDAYQKSTPLATVDEWKNYSNKQLWLRLVGQVMVAGGSRSKALFDRRSDLQQLLHFSRLEKLPDSSMRQNDTSGGNEDRREICWGRHFKVAQNECIGCKL